jgi:hypothetical protein
MDDRDSALGAAISGVRTAVLAPSLTLVTKRLRPPVLLSVCRGQSGSAADEPCRRSRFAEAVIGGKQSGRSHWTRGRRAERIVICSNTE